MEKVSTDGFGLSVVILTFNSQKHLAKVLKGVEWADEVLCVDSGSTDGTIDIINAHKNTRLIKQPWLGFGRQKQHGVGLASNEWVFVLDSDEICTKELKDEICDVLADPKFMAYKVPRLNYFFGKPIENMGLYPDYTIRLFNKNHAHFSDDDVHEKVLTKSSTGKLKNHFIHYAYDSIEQFIAKQNRYSSLGARQNRLKAILSPAWTFFRLFALKGGWREGWRGYVVAKLYAQYTFWKYIK